MDPEQKLSTYADLYRAYLHSRQWDKAIATLQERTRLRPDDATAQAWLGWWLANHPDPASRDIDQALERAGIAVRLAPKNGNAWEAMGAASYRAGDWPGAIAAFEKARRIFGARSGTYQFAWLAMAHWQQGNKEEARQWYDRSAQWLQNNLQRVRKDPGLSEYDLRRLQAEAAQLLGIEDPGPAAKEASEKPVADDAKAVEIKPEAWIERARRHVARGQWDKASEDFAQMFKLIPDDLESTFEFAGALLLAGDTEGYKRFCAHLLERRDNLKYWNHPGRRSNLLARIFLMSPATEVDPAEASRLADEAVLAQPEVPWNLHALGLAHYRTGRYDEAVKRLQESMQVDPKWPAQPVNWLTLAMAHHRLGHDDEAREWLDKAVKKVDKNRQEKPRALTGLGMHPHDWMAWLLLRREAEALIKATEK